MKEKNQNINYYLPIKYSGWGTIICLGLFFLNIIVGKIMHITKVSVNPIIDGPAEFLLLALVIGQFSVCVLLKESAQLAKEKKEI